MVDGVKIAQDAQRSKSATKFRKKLFSINGRSPDSRTKAFIHAKQNADKIMLIMPFCRSDREIFDMRYHDFFH